MINENYVIKKEIKYQLLSKTLINIQELLKVKNKAIFNDQDSFLKDGIVSLQYIIDNQKARYQDSFFIMLSINKEFLEIKNKVDNNEINFSHITEEDFWDNDENIDIDSSVFFAYTFLNELYKKELKISFEKLQEINNPIEYIDFRNEIINS